MDTVEFQGRKCPASYLGDGVYAIYDGFGIWLRTGDHREEYATNNIYFEPQVVDSFNLFIKQLCEMRKEGERKESQNMAENLNQ